MLVASKVSKEYATPRGAVRVLDDVSLSIAPGDAVAITGPSGCGKSTLLYLLGALEPPTAGSVLINGTDPYRLGEREQAAFRGASIGFVFQDHLLLPQLSAVDNVLMPTLVAGTGERPEAVRQRAVDLLTDVGLGRRLEHRPAELSGGERQRAAIARALIRQPPILLCDEPTGNLDSRSADIVADVLAQVHVTRKTILVVVTHNASLASRFGRRYELSHRIVEPGS